MTALPYGDDADHLHDELRRIDALVRAQTVRWQATIASAKPAELWGMVNVTEAEVDRYLQSPFRAPFEPAEDVEQLVPHFVAAARSRRQAIDARLRATAGRTMPRLHRLRQAFGLSDAECDALLVCLLAQLDARYRRLYGYLQDDASQPAATLELVLDILRPVLDGPRARTMFAGSARLVANELLLVGDERHDPRPAGARPVRVDERVVAYLLGSDGADDRLADVVAVAPGTVGWAAVPAEAERVAELRALADRIDRPGTVLLLEGIAGSGRLVAARALCSDARRPLLVADLEAALHVTEPFERVVGLCAREARLRDAALIWTRCGPLMDPAHGRERSERVVAAAIASNRATLLAVPDGWEPPHGLREAPFVRVRFAAPSYDLRRRLWSRLLPDVGAHREPGRDRAALAERLANQFSLSYEQMLDALAEAQAEARKRDPAAPRVTAEDVREGCRRQSGRRLATLARRVEPGHSSSLDDLVLPPSSRGRLDELRARIRHHARVHSGLGFVRTGATAAGLVAMFTGASGTGKTLAATLLAAEHGVDLYKIDLSAVVSKYVGETEKNLSQVFSEAEGTSAILFFDEADALFGKRGEVRDARDRWANVEVNYLLQRIEEFGGPVILASNLSQNIDEAFLRRIHVIVDFPFPDAEARLGIWRRVFPPGLVRPADDELAVIAQRFALPGGSIRNIALDATFGAVAEGNGAPPSVTLRHVARATAREYEKLHKPISRGEFGDLYSWVEPPLDAVAGPPCPS